MSSFLYLTLGALFALLVSRWHKSPSTYVALLCTLLFGFVVGTGIKDAVANASNVPTQELVTASNPTDSDLSSAVVETVDNFEFTEPSKEMKSDTVKTNSGEVTQQPNNSEIEDDS